MKKNLFLFFLFVFGTANANTIEEAPTFPYNNNCNQAQKDRTNGILPIEQEADYCFVCNKTEDPVQDIKQYLIEVNSIPKQCWAAIASRGNKAFATRQYVHCSNKANSNGIRGEKLCINETYVDKISKAFNEMSHCFNFDLKKQQEIFHLINQESKGVLNVRSTTGARCLGQLTADYIDGINKTINSLKRTRSSPVPHAEIYNEVLQRCPDIANHRITENNHTCATTKNPYTCLFYTFFGLEKNHREMQTRLNSISDYMGNREFLTAEDVLGDTASDSSKRRYNSMLDQLPLKVNEMLHIKGTAKTGKNIDWVLWDDSELHKYYRTIDFTKDVEITKVPLFKNETHIETMFNYWAHNGGSSLVRSSLVTRVEKWKTEISRGCSDGNTERRCLARAEIESGNGVSSNHSLEFIAADLRTNYPSRKARRRSEVSEYVRNILDTNHNAFTYNEGSAATNAMLRAYKNNGLTQQSAEDFQKYVSETCPKISFDHEPI